MNQPFSRTLLGGFAIILCFYSVQGDKETFLQVVVKPAIKGTDCSDIHDKNPTSTSGTYMVKPAGSKIPFQVFCVMDKGAGWTVIQRHNGQDSLSFARSWKEYQNGFGNTTGEHWLGLDNIHALTNQNYRESQLHVVLEDFNNRKAFARYSSFIIGNENDLYKLTLGKYSGNAGDGFRGKDANTNQNGSPFSTIDKDNDGCFWCELEKENCGFCVVGDMAIYSCSGEATHSGWWFHRCGMADLNGDWSPKTKYMYWDSGIYWKTWTLETLKSSELRLRIGPKITDLVKKGF
ncbi:angiopoietin-related protein 5-like [Ascaphus truei]|uniref:angiopoietin-related protein 5-like n=1 Tax=Ascaphus truei TaxID=8439 RepID=UPI003F59F9E1